MCLWNRFASGIFYMLYQNEKRKTANSDKTTLPHGHFFVFISIIPLNRINQPRVPSGLHDMTLPRLFQLTNGLRLLCYLSITIYSFCPTCTHVKLDHRRDSSTSFWMQIFVNISRTNPVLKDNRALYGSFVITFVIKCTVSVVTHFIIGLIGSNDYSKCNIYYFLLLLRCLFICWCDAENKLKRCELQCPTTSQKCRGVCSKNTRTVWIARFELVSGESAWCR